jgi:hypothetical protein
MKKQKQIIEEVEIEEFREDRPPGFREATVDCCFACAFHLDRDTGSICAVYDWEIGPTPMFYTCDSHEYQKAETLDANQIH